ncbi:MAG: hypothetical protein JWM54_2000 [Acidobacteriaceae bacterium]|nr:hypothetical protein [Acidobacteriaceae bacterium]
MTAGRGAAMDTPDEQRRRNSPQHHPAHHAEAVHEAKELCLRAEWRYTLAIAAAWTSAAEMSRRAMKLVMARGSLR